MYDDIRSRDLSRVYSAATWDVYERLDHCLNPRGPDWLHDKATEYLPPGAMILDAGCRDAAHLIRLVRDNQAIGVGVEPVAVHLERAHAAVAEAGLEHAISLVHGTVEDWPVPSRSFDLVWCRDVLEQVARTL